MSPHGEYPISGLCAVAVSLARMLPHPLAMGYRLPHCAEWVFMLPEVEADELFFDCRFV